MSPARIRLPSGVRDFLPRAAARRRAIAESVLGALASWGYARIITPLFEHADVLERGLGDDARAAVIRFIEPGTGEVVALRPDITPQVARIAATRMRDLGGPLRLCYAGSVTRLAGGARGQRELMQAGAELIGAPSPEGDAEILAVAASALGGLGLARVALDIGHAAPARWALAEVRDTGRGDLAGELAAALAAKDRGGVASLARGLPARVRRVLVALPTLYGDPADVLARARALPLPAPVAAAVDELALVLVASRESIARARAAAGEDSFAITCDLGEARGFEYYTGLRLAGYADGAGDALLRGGRYDELVGRYGRPAPAVGFAVDVEAIARAQPARLSGGGRDGEPAAVLIRAARSRKRQVDALAAELRARGVRAAVDLGPHRAPSAIAAYADAAGFARVLFVTRSGARAVSSRGRQGERDAMSEIRTFSLALVRSAAAGARSAVAELVAGIALDRGGA